MYPTVQCRSKIDETELRLEVGLYIADILKLYEFTCEYLVIYALTVGLFSEQGLTMLLAFTTANTLLVPSSFRGHSSLQHLHPAHQAINSTLSNFYSIVSMSNFKVKAFWLMSSPLGGVRHSEEPSQRSPDAIVLWLCIYMVSR